MSDGRTASSSKLSSKTIHHCRSVTPALSTDAGDSVRIVTSFTISHNDQRVDCLRPKIRLAWYPAPTSHAIGIMLMYVDVC